MTPRQTAKRKRGKPATPTSIRSSNFFAASAQRQQQRGERARDELSLDELSDAENIPSPSIKRQRTQSAIVLSSDEGEPTLPKARSRPITSKPIFRTRRSRRSVGSEDEAASRNEADVVHSGRLTRGRPKRADEMQHANDDSEDEVIVSPRRTWRSNQKSKGTNGVPNGSMRSPVSKTSTRKASSSSDDDSMGDELAVSSTRSKRLRQASKIKQAPVDESTSGSSAEDIREDVRDLDETQVIKHRTRGGPAANDRNARQQQLQRLKRRRAHNEFSSEPNLGDSEDGRPGRSKRSKKPISISSNYEDGDDEDDATVVSDQAADFAEGIQALGDGDEEVDDFVVSDDDAPLGAPADLLNDIPIQFTSHAHKKPIVYFQHAVEWMVHNKLNPAFSRHDQIYTIAFQKLDDEIKGLMGSKFMSSVWTPDFITTLRSKPELVALEIPTMFEQKCGACNRSKHPPTQLLTFQGKPYHPFSLEPLSDDDDSDDNSNEDDPDPTLSLNPSSSSISSPSPTKTRQRNFHVGRICCANAETAHALHHWRYHLNQYILSWLSSQGHISARKIVERDKWKQRKKEAFANEVVDGMVENGEMKRLYREFKENLEAARGANVDAVGYRRRR